jgi:hypothetical protein
MPYSQCTSFVHAHHSSHTLSIVSIPQPPNAHHHLSRRSARAKTTGAKNQAKTFPRDNWKIRDVLNNTIFVLSSLPWLLHYSLHIIVTFWWRTKFQSQLVSMVKKDWSQFSSNSKFATLAQFWRQKKVALPPFFFRKKSTVRLTWRGNC